jgi:hypothetical protein
MRELAAGQSIDLHFMNFLASNVFAARASINFAVGPESTDGYVQILGEEIAVQRRDNPY